MALSTSVLSAALRGKLLANSAVNAVDGPALTALCDEIAAAVVEHIVAAAVVLPGTFVAPPGTAGGPITGAGVVT